MFPVDVKDIIIEFTFFFIGIHILVVFLIILNPLVHVFLFNNYINKQDLSEGGKGYWRFRILKYGKVLSAFLIVALSYLFFSYHSILLASLFFGDMTMSLKN